MLDLDIVGGAAVPHVPPGVDASVGVLAADLEAGHICGRVSNGAVTSLRPHTGAVEVVGQVDPAIVVE